MKRNKLIIGIVSMIAVLLLSACANETEENTGTETESNTEEKNDMESESDSHEGMDHSEMNMSSTGEVPEGLEEAENPTYEVGSQAMIETDHMEGMKVLKRLLWVHMIQQSILFRIPQQLAERKLLIVNGSFMKS